MVLVSPIQVNFNGGELSPRLEGRIDLKPYAKGLRLCRNWVPLPQGPLSRRPGTVFVKEVKTSNKPTRLIRFVFSQTQAYVLEFGHQYVRFYRNRGQILSGGSPYEVSTPYSYTELADLYVTQSADVLYICHPSYAPRMLTRTADTSWTLATVPFVDGPYLDINTTTTTVTLATGSVGSQTLTASASLFVSTDVGRHFRIERTGNWTWGIITAYTSATEVTIDLKVAIGTGATDQWRFGALGTVQGYPRAVGFHQNRLFFAGPASQPQRIFGSTVGDYYNFGPSALTGALVSDDNAVSYTLNSDQVETISWISSLAGGLGVGTIEAEWLLRPSSLGEALTPTNVQAIRSTTVGSALGFQPVNIQNEVLFVQGAKKQLHTFAYTYELDQYGATNLTYFADHIAANGLKFICYQKNPYGIVWAGDTNGTLLSFTYAADQEVLAWAQHETDGDFKSGVSIPNPTGTGDDVWFIVERTINGSVVQYVEYMSEFFSDTTLQADAGCLDASLSYSGTATTTLTGLAHLEGKTVKVLANGASVPDVVVASGSITLPVAVTKAVVGLAYTSLALLQRIEAGAVQGTSQGDTKRISRMFVRMWRSLGVRVAETVAGLTTVVFRNMVDPLGEAVPLKSGDAEVVFPGGYSEAADVYVENGTAFPATVLALVAEMIVNEVG